MLPQTPWFVMKPAATATKLQQTAFVLAQSYRLIPRGATTPFQYTATLHVLASSHCLLQAELKATSVHAGAGARQTESMGLLFFFHASVCVCVCVYHPEAKG